METTESWEAFKRVSDKIIVTGLEDFIFFDGYFGHFPSSDVPPDKVYSVSSSVEKAVRDNFSGLGIIAMQTPPGRFIEQTEQGSLYRIYQSMVAVMRESDNIVQIFMQLSQTHPQVHIPLLPYSFIIALPLGELEENSKEVIKCMWPSMCGFEATISKVPEGKPKEDFGPGAIYLVQKRDVIAAGLPAISKIGLSLPRKRVDYIGGYTA